MIDATSRLSTSGNNRSFVSAGEVLCMIRTKTDRQMTDLNTVKLMMKFTVEVICSIGSWNTDNGIIGLGRCNLR